MASSSGVGSNQHGGMVTYDVYIANIPAEVNQIDLRNIFMKYGEIHSVYMKDSTRNDNTKIAYVRFPNEEHANKAALEMQNYNHQGAKLYTRRSEPRKKPQTKQMENQNRWQKVQVNQKSNMFGQEPDIVPQGGSTFSPDKVYKQPRGDFLKEKMMITYIESPVTFYGQICNDKSEQLVSISEKLATVCSCASKLPNRPSLKNKIYATQFSEDMSWYRCQALEYVGENETRVQYIDYGNCEVVNNSMIVELPQNLTSTPAFASLYCLKGLKPVCPDPKTEDFIKGVDYLKLCMENKVVNATIYAPRSGAGTPQVEIEHESVDIGESMLVAGHVFRHFSSQSDPSKLQNQINTHMKRLQQSQNDGSGDVRLVGNVQNISGSALAPGVDVFKLKGPRKIISSDNSFNEKSGMLSMPKAMNNTSPGSADVDSMRAEMTYMRKELDNAYKQLQALKNARHECESVKNDRDLLMQQLNASKVQLNAVQKDFETVCQRLKDCNLSEKLQGLLIRVEKVKELRLQFPTDTNAKDNVDEAVKLVTDCASRMCLKDVVTIPGLHAAHEHYRTCQEQIQGTHDKAALDELIKLRDEARIQLDANMQEFLTEVEKLPMQARLNELKEAKSELEQSHGRIMKAYSTDGLLPLTDALSIYKDWQEQRYLEFSDVRTTTNTLHNGVNNVLRTLQQNLSLEPALKLDTQGTCCNLDSLLNRFDQAVRIEIDKTDVENMGDARTVALVLLAVMEEMKQEEADIEQLLQMKQDNQDQKLALARWLQQKPDVSHIKDIRKTIRSLKSKLRHLLADIEDIKEEVEDVDEDRLAAVKTELSELRYQLHVAFQQEDQVLDELAQLNDNHFPELCQQYPELGIENHAEYGGLVKQGRDLDQLCIENLAGVDKKSILKTHFLDHDVILKEYIVDEALGLKKSDFLKRALNYKAVCSPHILPLEAIFFLKNDRQACVQMPYFSKKLRTVVEENQTSEQGLDIPGILGGVLKGLHALHEAKLIHGHIHPDNVYVNEQGKGVLAEYDFSKSLIQRASKVHSVSSGLKFLPPEVKMPRVVVTRASDMYNFGLLMLWIHFPHVHFSDIDGLPDFSELGLPQNVLDMIHNLLTPDPAMRLTTEQLLQLTFFASKESTDVLQLRHRQSSPVHNASQTVTNGRPGILKNPSPPTPEGVVESAHHQNVSIATAETCDSDTAAPHEQKNDSVESESQKTLSENDSNNSHDGCAEDKIESEEADSVEPPGGQSMLDVEMCSSKPDILETVGTETIGSVENADVKDSICEGQSDEVADAELAESEGEEADDAENGNSAGDGQDEEVDGATAETERNNAEERQSRESSPQSDLMKGIVTENEHHRKSRFTTAALLSSRIGAGRGLSLSATLAVMGESEIVRPGGQVEEDQED